MIETQFLKGGICKINLSLVGITKEENNSVPSVSADDISKTIVGINEQREYSTDNGLTYIEYKNIVTFNNNATVYVRYKETDELLASKTTIVKFGGGN